MWIEEEQICTVDEMLPPSVRPVTGISSTHQVLSFAPGKILAVSARIQGCAPVTSCTNLSLTMFSLMRCQVTRQVMTVAHLLKCPLSNLAGPLQIPEPMMVMPSSPSSLPTREPQAHSSTQVLYAGAQSSASSEEAQAEDSDTIS
ncbi:uncharacterized protein LOC113067463 isoform X2 [Carassius auratus]|uniref:Uncharacterized protein LOC113067463 isoform X2 n=1 Tax=Carassius auratus TaxID=7957 RepID=A0A6P6MI32_CARAU|nr:uncharacterized protein LOC113067463 isoform X2 [Carassius auratus]